MLQKLRLILLPFSWIYGSVTAIRNLFFYWGWFKQTSFPKPVIALGNLTVGGTGKTPHADYLITLLKPFYKVGLVSRGYMRQTKGVVVSQASSTAAEIGDEPMQLKRKHKELTVVASEKRVLGVDACLGHPSQPDVVVLDDAFQHRYVKPGLSILLIDYRRPIWRDFVLPAGNLREFRCGKKRADIVIITKCPSHLRDDEAREISLKLKLKPNQPLYFTSFEYGLPYALYGNEKVEILHDDKLIALSAIASPGPFIDYLKSQYVDVEIVTYGDHHAFTLQEMQQLAYQFEKADNQRKWIVITEKDAVKILEINNIPTIVKSAIIVLPIEPAFLFNQIEKFNQQILEYVRKS
jgi:tetraacyldisaccharide 4'-kinase